MPDPSKPDPSKQNQVALFHLLFGRSWEDPAIDARALAIQPTDTLLTVTSGACNTFTLLLQDPAKVFAVDINPTQSHLYELKAAAIRHLNPDELRAFLGLASSLQRPQTYARLASSLSEPARSFWDSKPDLIRNGIINAGTFDAFVRYFARAVRLMQGRRRVNNLFACTTLEEQRAFFAKHWNTPQWRLLFRLSSTSAP